MKRIRPTLGLVAGLLIAVSGLLAGCATQSASAREVSLLYSLSADSVALEPIGDGSVVRMTLSGVDPHVVWFEDRPQRGSGVKPTSWLADQWAPGSQFDQDPPNAALVFHEPVGSTDTLVAVVRHPAYDAASDQFTAELELLSGEDAKALDGNLAVHGDSADPEVPRSGGAVSLFIDPEVGYCDIPPCPLP